MSCTDFQQTIFDTKAVASACSLNERRINRCSILFFIISVAVNIMLDSTINRSIFDLLPLLSRSNSREENSVSRSGTKALSAQQQTNCHFGGTDRQHLG